MNQLFIKRKIIPEDIDGLYQALYEMPGTDLDIILPREVEQYDIGLLPLLLQFLGACLRSKSGAKLVIDIEPDEHLVEGFMSQPFAYPSVILFWFKGVVTLKAKTNLKPLLVRFTNKIRFDMMSLTNIRGQRLLLTCFDHFTPEKGLLDCFYDGDRFVRSDSVLSFTLDRAIRNVLSFNKKASAKSVAPIIDDLIAIIYELMKNTDEWGKTDSYDKPVGPNVRGLYLRFLKRPKAKMIERYQGFSALADYFQSCTAVAGDMIYFLEISVFDCGIGFVEKSKRKPMDAFDLTQQVDIVKECLIKNNTSAHGLKKEGKGLGLDRILNTLNNKGLLWIRTSNVSLFRNLRKTPYSLSADAREVSLYDWQQNSNTAYTPQPKTAGAVVSILYPITLSDE